MEQLPYSTLVPGEVALCKVVVLLSVYFPLDFYTRYGSMDKERQI